MEIKPERVELVVLAACSLHNMIRTLYPALTNHLLDHEDTNDHLLIPGEWRQGPLMENLEVLRGNNSTNAGKAYREYLMKYFSSNAGKVPWQDRVARLVH
jgi:hypothetical protein